MDLPETRYAKTTDGVHIAYQVVGEGPIDVVLMNSIYTSNVEITWQWWATAQTITGLAAHARLLLFDRRGTGLSDGVRPDALPTLEDRMDDIRAVMDAAGSERAALVTLEDGAGPALLFGATFPERILAIVTWGATARGSWAPDYPWAWDDKTWDDWLAKVEAQWGTLELAQELCDWMAPSLSHDPTFVRSYAHLTRHSLSPGAALSAERMARDLDIRELLPSVQVPTLVVQAAGDDLTEPEEGRYFAARIPNATYVELPGGEHVPGAAFLAEVDRFLTSIRAEEQEFDRVLATILFTDIVGSTDKAAELGDSAWRALLERHHATVRAAIGRYRGVEVNTAGDGFLATFDGPARAIRCAEAIVAGVQPLGLQIRAGLHTGEVETIDGQVGGIAVHVGARIGAMAPPSQIFVSSTVKDLTLGSGLTFQEVGEHELKGVPGSWRIYQVSSERSISAAVTDPSRSAS